METQVRLTRRQLLLGCTGGASVIALTPSPTWARAREAGPATMDEFMDLSEALTDGEFSLRDEVGRRYFVAVDPIALQRLVQATVRRKRPPRTFDEILASGALDDDLNARTAQQILTFWYSGLVNGTTADYLEALAWESLKDGDLAAPSSTPYGFPDWQDRP